MRQTGLEESEGPGKSKEQLVAALTSNRINPGTPASVGNWEKAPSRFIPPSAIPTSGLEEKVIGIVASEEDAEELSGWLESYAEKHQRNFHTVSITNRDQFTEGGNFDVLVVVSPKPDEALAAWIARRKQSKSEVPIAVVYSENRQVVEGVADHVMSRRSVELSPRVVGEVVDLMLFRSATGGNPTGVRFQGLGNPNPTPSKPSDVGLEEGVLSQEVLTPEGVISFLESAFSAYLRKVDELGLQGEFYPLIPDLIDAVNYDISRPGALHVGSRHFGDIRRSDPFREEAGLNFSEYVTQSMERFFGWVVRQAAELSPINRVTLVVLQDYRLDPTGQKDVPVRIADFRPAQVEDRPRPDLETRADIGDATQTGLEEIAPVQGAADFRELDTGVPAYQIAVETYLKQEGVVEAMDGQGGLLQLGPESATRLYGRPAVGITLSRSGIPVDFGRGGLFFADDEIKPRSRLPWTSLNDWPELRLAIPAARFEDRFLVESEPGVTPEIVEAEFASYFGQGPSPRAFLGTAAQHEAIPDEALIAAAATDRLPRVAVIGVHFRVNTQRGDFDLIIWV